MSRNCAGKHLMYVHTHRKADGRFLRLYGRKRRFDLAAQEVMAPPPSSPHLRWHPLRQEWVIYAAHRQTRTFLPPEHLCPLCPTRSEHGTTEIPFADFEVAVFENRFPALVEMPAPPPDVPARVGAAAGSSEVIVYSPQHDGSAGDLAPERLETIVEVWSDRYTSLYERREVQFVMPFENHGEDVGVTIHHPHGQLYAYPFVPPVIQQEADAFRTRPVLLEMLEGSLADYVVTENDAAVAFVPVAARFPYEIWIVPRRFHPGPWTFEGSEIRGVAALWGVVARAYDHLFDQQPVPYVMVLHAAPKGHEATFHFHIEFYPMLRGKNRKKFLAGTELGAGVYTVDVMPEAAATTLRSVLADTCTPAARDDP
jgi:UDPglucose--hexose-1-phosphate uridylyltransferase